MERVIFTPVVLEGGEGRWAGTAVAIFLGGTADHPHDAVERDDATTGAGGYRDFVVATPIDVTVDKLTIDAGDLHVVADHPAGSGALKFEHVGPLLGGPGNVFDVLIIDFDPPEVHAPRGQYLGACCD